MGIGNCYMIDVLVVGYATSKCDPGITIILAFIRCTMTSYFSLYSEFLGLN